MRSHAMLGRLLPNPRVISDPVAPDDIRSIAGAMMVDLRDATSAGVLPLLIR